MRLPLKLAFAIDDFLRPLGLILWFTIEIKDDEEGLPTGPLRVRSLRIGRRPRIVDPRP